MSLAPVIICGLPQSQVGQITALLAGEDSLLLPEMNLFMAPSLGALQLLFERSQDDLGDGLHRALAWLEFQDQNNHAINQAKDLLWRRSDWTGAQLLNQLQTKASPRRLFIADRHIAWRPNYLHALIHQSDALFVHVLREPASHCAELNAHWAQQAFVPPEFKDHFGNPQGRIDTQMGWYRFHRNALKAADALGPRYLRLDVDKLCRQPQKLVDDIDRTLGRKTKRANFLAADSVFQELGPSLAPAGMEASFFQNPNLNLSLSSGLHPQTLLPEVRDLYAQLS